MDGGAVLSLVMLVFTGIMNLTMTGVNVKD